MAQHQHMVSRRSLLAGGVLGGSTWLAAGCVPGGRTGPSPTGSASTALGQLDALEHETGRTIGLVVLDAGGSSVLEHRADEMFPICSLFKVLAVGGLLAEKGVAGDDWWRTTQIEYDASDVVVDSAVLAERSGPITPEELADAALRFSDNTAGNLLMEQLGGPRAVTRFAESLGAVSTRLDRWEPDLNEARPGDPRDTTTPGEIALLLHRLLLERAEGAFVSARLHGWMLRNTTSQARMRPALASSDELADKTGAGGYGANNDAGVLYREGEPPVTIAILTRADEADAEIDHTLLQRATEIAIAA